MIPAVRAPLRQTVLREAGRQVHQAMAPAVQAAQAVRAAPALAPVPARAQVARRAPAQAAPAQARAARMADIPAPAAPAVPALVPAQEQAVRAALKGLPLVMIRYGSRLCMKPAVYEKVRVYVCTYCQAEFASAGEFQVHKDANGG